MDDDEKKIGKSMDDEFKIPLVWAGENCDLTREQNAEERREQKRRRILALKEYRANKPRPQNKSKFTHFRVPVTVTFSDYFPERGAIPEVRVIPGILARAKELNKDLGVSSEENQKIYQQGLSMTNFIGRAKL